MARMSSPWHALRPVLLAGAAAVTWLALSSTPATADATPDSSSLLGGATSPVSSLTQDLAASPVSLVHAGSTGSPGLLQPAVAPVSGVADNLIAAVPVVDHVVPAGTASAVSAPLVDLADKVTAGVAQEVVAPAAAAVPVLEPALQPVADLLTGTAPLPVPPLEAVQTDLPAVAIPAPAQDQASSAEESPDARQTTPESGQAVEALSTAATAQGSAGVEVIGLGGLANTAAPQLGVSGTAGSVTEQPLTVDIAPPPAQAPAAPASGTGSGGSSGGTPGAAAWLNPFYFDFDGTRAVRADLSPAHVPSPVSFDPGSSPD